MDAQLPDPILAINIRINIIERDIVDLKEQLVHYVPIRENELQLKSMRDIVERIERDVQQVRKQLDDMNAQLTAQEKEAQTRGTLAILLMSNAIMANTMKAGSNKWDS